ncbi:MAG: serine/threonine-protein kinase pkn1 [Microcystis viridis Mv_BB_P_19951000_S69D]|uniref:Serine/threonine-protein kinase pkn1 n=1 Tax=Microcystis viridis Mv_BB_P_19951000_S68D TaxID=2486270 RepID=A0A552H6H7_MICVR|nr:MAG: serine/threonine-protein kinase pkn1 [Microcystis viridis Mv_BB_P_19951000_S68D]TRU80973.1 MAG: serine/threonine-protein kinase pkn1 [Microcystis viridis Mv_BB_P_19951000_S69D]
MAAETAKIKLYRKTYQLPRLNRPDLLILQDQIQERQQLIKTGKRVRHTWLGLRKKEEPLNFEETFQELERLVEDYNQLIRFLTDHKDEYLKPIIGQFQGLIDRVVTIDGELSRSVSEVESLVQKILSSESAVSFGRNENLSASLLNFLVTSEEKRSRLASALERAEQEGWQWTEAEIPDEEIELETAIQRINNHVIERVGNFATSVIGDSPIPPRTQPETALGNKTSFTENLPKRVTLEMVSLPAGQFLMGSSERDNEKPPHQVKVNSFAIGKYPVTQAQYQAVMGTNPSHFKNNPQNPVEKVSWNDAQAFCQKLSQITGKTYRLPTEAEWEYACRAGTTTRYYFGDDANQLGDYAWYSGNSGNKTHPVGQKKPNAWGLYDMSGNVWEWCEDNRHENYIGAPEDGSAWLINNDNRSQSSKCPRGGSWCNNPDICRSAYRYDLFRRDNYDFSGFRVVWYLRINKLPSRLEKQLVTPTLNYGNWTD